MLLFKQKTAYEMPRRLVGSEMCSRDRVLESDKASLEIPSPAAGTVKKLLVKTGDKITSGTELMVLETTGGGEETADEATAGEDKSAGKQSGESGSGESKPGAVPYSHRTLQT